MRKRDFIKSLAAFGITMSSVGISAEKLSMGLHTSQEDDWRWTANPAYAVLDHQYLVLDFNDLMMVRPMDVGGEDNKELYIEFFCPKREEAERIANHLVEHMPSIRKMIAKVTLTPPQRPARASIKAIVISQWPADKWPLPDHLHQEAGSFEPPIRPMLIKMTLTYEGMWDEYTEQNDRSS